MYSTQWSNRNIRCIPGQVYLKPTRYSTQVIVWLTIELYKHSRLLSVYNNVKVDFNDISY